MNTLLLLDLLVLAIALLAAQLWAPIARHCRQRLLVRRCRVTEDVRSGPSGTLLASGPPDHDELIVGTCDCCPGAAAVRVRLRNGSVLMLCGHHARSHASALRMQGAVVSGERRPATPATQVSAR